MNHKCLLNDEDEFNSIKFKRYQKLIYIYIDNPLRLEYFRSDTSVKQEQIRQLKTNKYTIHPYSRFRAWYEMYLIYLYGAVLLIKPFNAGFLKAQDCKGLTFYIFYSIFLDILCWLDIALNFITGYERKNLHIIELRKWKIAKNYILGPYFICDLLSSFPKCILYFLQKAYVQDVPTWSWRNTASGITSILGLFKVVRIATFVKCIWRTADYLNFKSKSMLFLVCTLLGSFMIIHWLTCMQYAVPRLYRIQFHHEINPETWFFSTKIYEGTVFDDQNAFIRYNHCLFKCSAYILGIPLYFYGVSQPEEYILGILTVFTGKILMGFIWIILAVSMLNARIMEMRFAEVINQLEEYMKKKQLPMDLRTRILQHFQFKFHNRYYDEELIIGLLSENLKSETQVHMCKSLIDNVSLFRDLSPDEIGKVVEKLVPVIFLPNDTIIHAGTQGDAMYFIASGTVVVYTRSGKEICHLQDGAYFGEISLVIKRQLRSATIKALEMSQVYRLQKKDLEKHLLSNKAVMVKVLRNAEERLREASRLEEQYKEMLLEQTIRDVVAPH